MWGLVRLLLAWLGGWGCMGRLAAPAQSCRCSITRAPERAQDVCRGSCHSLIRALIGPMGGHMPEPQ